MEGGRIQPRNRLPTTFEGNWPGGNEGPVRENRRVFRDGHDKKRKEDSKFDTPTKERKHFWVMYQRDTKLRDKKSEPSTTKKPTKTIYLSL